MKHFKTISEYCKAINIPQPKHPHFDIRSFEENMKTVVTSMEPFRHEFYAIAIKSEGGGKVFSGQFDDFPEGITVFFNTPFQILSWDIIPDWEGYYLMFSQDFIAGSNYFTDMLQRFPYLKMDSSLPFEIGKEDFSTIANIFRKVWEEYYGEAQDKFEFIEVEVLLLLSYIKRYFTEQVDEETAKTQMRTADLRLFTRYQALIETSFQPNFNKETFSNLHSTSHYAARLSVHPNHLNAVVKNITGHTALSHIHNHLLQLSKAYLAQTDLSVKEIAYTLLFDSPNNFSAFFKKHTGMTPLEYRRR